MGKARSFKPMTPLALGIKLLIAMIFFFLLISFGGSLIGETSMKYWEPIGEFLNPLLLVNIVLILWFVVRGIKNYNLHHKEKENRMLLPAWVFFCVFPHTAIVALPWAMYKLMVCGELQNKTSPARKTLTVILWMPTWFFGSLVIHMAGKFAIIFSSSNPTGLFYVFAVGFLLQLISCVALWKIVSKIADGMDSANFRASTEAVTES
jgi:hypothetical protein